MSDILVIGASSFTGNRFCELMEQQGHRVERASWRDNKWIATVAKPRKYIVNFAALNVVSPSWDHADDYIHQNVTKIALLARALRDVPLTKYVHVSTPEVYGNQEGPIKEDAYFDPSTPYAVSRCTAEGLLICEHKQYGLPVVFTRACNVYGPGQQLYRLIPKVLWCIKKGVKFPLEGGGTSKRAFCYVDDVCEATRLVMVKGRAGEAYNISHAEGIRTINSVVHICCHVTGADPEGIIQRTDPRPGQDPAYELDDSKIRALGFESTVSPDEGITRTWQWLNDNWDTLKDASTTYEFRP